MKDLLLVNPPVPFLAFPNAGPHMGLLYLISFLRAYGFTVDYLNLEDVDPAKVMLPEGYRFYGLTAVTPQYPFAEQLRRQIQRRKLGKVILGGIHASVLPKSCLRDGYDYVVTGYGEIALLQILSGVSSSGIVKGKAVRNLDELPFPAWDSVGKPFDVAYGQGKNIGQILTMRGCPFSCYYCCSEKVYGSEAFFRSVENVEAEIKFLVETFGITHLYFYDTCFTYDRGRGIRISRVLKKYGLRWSCQTRVDLVDPELLRIMKQGGCEQISFGVETGSDAVIRLGKKTNENINALAIKMCKDAGIRVKIFLMGALPDDTLRTNGDFKEFIMRNTPDDFLYSTFIPFPGTAYWEEPENFGLEICTRDPLLFYPLGLNGRGPIIHRTAHLTRDELHSERDSMLNFLLKAVGSWRVEKAIELFPKQKEVFDRALGEFVY